jgi:hypothetical protein
MCDMVRGFSSEGWGSHGGDSDNHGCDDLQDIPPYLDCDFQRPKWRSFDRNSKKYTGKKNKFSINGSAIKAAMAAFAKNWRAS